MSTGRVFVPLTDQGVADEVDVRLEAEPFEDDDDARFERLIEKMVTPDEAAIEASEVASAQRSPRSLRRGEFRCRSCRLIMARPLLADPVGMICRECVRRRMRSRRG